MFDAEPKVVAALKAAFYFFLRKCIDCATFTKESSPGTLSSAWQLPRRISEIDRRPITTLQRTTRCPPEDPTAGQEEVGDKLSIVVGCHEWVYHHLWKGKQMTRSSRVSFGQTTKETARLPHRLWLSLMYLTWKSTCSILCALTVIALTVAVSHVLSHFVYCNRMVPYVSFYEAPTNVRILWPNISQLMWAGFPFIPMRSTEARPPAWAGVQP